MQTPLFRHCFPVLCSSFSELSRFVVSRVLTIRIFLVISSLSSITAVVTTIQPFPSQPAGVERSAMVPRLPTMPFPPSLTRRLPKKKEERRRKN